VLVSPIYRGRKSEREEKTSNLNIGQRKTETNEYLLNVNDIAKDLSRDVRWHLLKLSDRERRLINFWALNLVVHL
jgi:hypothetical protein